MNTISEIPSNQQTKEDRISVVEINSYLFGVDILRSKEVFPLPEITPVPNTRNYLLGVFNHRGEIYPLVDISPILGMELKEIQETDMVIILDGGEGSVGLLTDRVHGVQLISGGSAKSARGSIPKTMMEYVSGMISDRSADIYMLNVDRLLTTLNTGMPY